MAGQRPPQALRRLSVWLAAALLACAGADTRSDAAKSGPALWLAEAARPGAGALFLLGSVHMGLDSGASFGSGVDAAFESVDELVVEVDITRISDEQALELTQRHGSLDAPETVLDVLSAPTRQMFLGYLAQRNLDLATIERYKPWFLSLLIAQRELQAAGYQVELGVDSVLMRRARGRMAIVALESMASQLEMFDRLPMAVQDLMLKDILVRTDHFADEVAGLIAAWRSGDDAALEALVFAPLREFPELEAFYDVVFFERNAAMASRLAELDTDGKRRLVVLGAGHMVGERGVLALLARRGYRLTRIRDPEQIALRRAAS